MGDSYVHTRDGNLYVGGSRVTVDSVVVLWLAGQTPEQIQADFPSLSLAQVYGTLAYYLEHRDEVDRYLAANDELRRAQRAEAEAADPERYAHLRRRFAEARDRLTSEGDVTGGSAAGVAHEPPLA